MAFICPAVKPNPSTGIYEALFRDKIPMETVGRKPEDNHKTKRRIS